MRFHDKSDAYCWMDLRISPLFSQIVLLLFAACSCHFGARSFGHHHLVAHKDMNMQNVNRVKDT